MTFRARSIAACLTWGAAARHSAAPPQPQLRAREQVLQVIRGKADPMTGKLPLNALSGGVLGAKVGISSRDTHLLMQSLLGSEIPEVDQVVDRQGARPNAQAC